MGLNGRCDMTYSPTTTGQLYLVNKVVWYRKDLPTLHSIHILRRKINHHHVCPQGHDYS